MGTGEISLVICAMSVCFAAVIVIAHAVLDGIEHRMAVHANPEPDQVQRPVESGRIGHYPYGFAFAASVRSGSLADVVSRTRQVRFTPQSGHSSAR